MAQFPLTLQTIAGRTVTIPDQSVRFVHLQFRRFAGCPICDTHLRALARRKDELVRAGVREVIFFHSSSAELRTYESDLPFDLIADPAKMFFRQFGVETSAGALLHPAIIAAAIRGAGIVFRGEARRLWIPRAENGRLGLPADFLVDRSGRIIAAKRGKHAYDQWSVDELLRLAHRTPEQSADERGWLDGLATTGNVRGISH